MIEEARCRGGAGRVQRRAQQHTAGRCLAAQRPALPSYRAVQGARRGQHPKLRRGAVARWAPAPGHMERREGGSTTAMLDPSGQLVTQYKISVLFQMGVLRKTIPDGAFCFVHEYCTYFDLINNRHINICLQCVDCYENRGYMYMYEERKHIQPEDYTIYQYPYPRSDEYCGCDGCVRRIVYKTPCQCIGRQAHQIDDASVEFDEYPI